MRVVLSPNLVCEEVGAELLVLVPSEHSAFSLSGETAWLVRNIEAQGALDVFPSPELTELVQRGIVKPLGSEPKLSRRGVLIGGAGVVGAGTLALGLPPSAMASSGVEFLTGRWRWLDNRTTAVSGINYVDELRLTGRDLPPELTNGNWDLTISPGVVRPIGSPTRITIVDSEFDDEDEEVLVRLDISQDPRIREGDQASYQSIFIDGTLTKSGGGPSYQVRFVAPIT